MNVINQPKHRVTCFPQPPLISFHPPSRSVHHTPPPVISVSLFLSACLFQDKNPATIFKDRITGRDVLVAKVMAAAI